MVAGVALGVVGLVLLIVAVQSPGAWKAAAEHSRSFWCFWAFAFVAAGLAPVAFSREVPTGGALAWLVVCCAFAALQPSLLVDVRDVRRHRRRMRAVRRAPVAGAFLAPMRVPALVEAITPIQWRAPVESTRRSTAPA